MTLAQGIHDIPMADYIADPCEEPALSKGAVKNLTDRSPLHAWAEHPRLGNRRSESSRSDIGSAAHAGLFGGNEIAFCDAEYKSGPRKGQIAEDWTSTNARRFQHEAREAGKIPMLESDREMLTEMADIAGKALETKGSGIAEQTLIWQEDGVWLKSRPDWISDDFDTAVDYKTTTNADPAVWTRRTMIAGGYDIQGAMFLRALDHMKGERQRQCLFLVQEIDYPYACSWVGLSPELEEHANTRKINRAIPIWKNCLDFQHWPSYDQNVYWADVPSGDLWAAEARELREKESK